MLVLTGEVVVERGMMDLNPFEKDDLKGGRAPGKGSFW